MKGYKKIPVLFMRGGTSRGAYLWSDDLPQNQAQRDEVILSLYGSPDARQIDGIGGADPLTSKVAILSSGEPYGVDIAYTFGYVGIEKAEVDYEGNCGNILSGVGIFAILKGLVEIVEPVTTVRIFNTNTQQYVEEHVPIVDGEPAFSGDFSIDGVPGTGAKLTLYFMEPAGSKTSGLLPTGKVRETVTLQDGQDVEVSMVDAATPAVFVKAADIGLIGSESASEIESDARIMNVLEELRVQGALRMGLAKSVAAVSSAVPKICVVAKSASYTCMDGRVIDEDSIDIVARTKALGKIHKAYAVTGGICTATASLITGTVANDVVSNRAKETKQVVIGHPSGSFEFNIDIECIDGEWVLHKAGVARTARPIMEGYAYVKTW